MIDNRWRLYSIEAPAEDGVYEVRLGKKHDLLSPDIETLMEYRHGEWILKVPMFINEYTVKAWRCR